LIAEESINAFFIMASDLICRGKVDAFVPGNMRKSSSDSYLLTYCLHKLMERGDLLKICIWNDITAGEIHGEIIECGGDIRSLTGGIRADSKIECSGNIISAGDIRAGAIGDFTKCPVEGLTSFAVIKASGFIESEDEVYSDYDIIAKDYIKASKAIRAANRLVVLGKDEIFAGEQIEPGIPSIIAREIVGTIKHGMWKKWDVKEYKKYYLS